MPCERKHIEAIREQRRRCCVYSLDAYPDAAMRLDIALREALAARDESPCVWTVKPSGRDFIPGCAPETSSAEAGWRYAWSAGFVKSMTYCPHCGHKIAPLPAAPEVGK